MKTVRAVKDKIVVEILKSVDKTEGGIFIPETAEKDPQGYGQVVSVGEEVVTIKEGDIVLFAKSGGQDILLDRQIMKVLMYGEVYGILEGATEFENLTIVRT